MNLKLLLTISLFLLVANPILADEQVNDISIYTEHLM